MSLTSNGTGLRVVRSPGGLRLSSSPFTTPPDEEMKVVDVYEVKDSGVINSIQDDVAPKESFFDKIKNSISAGLGALGRGIGNLTGLGQMRLPGIPGMPGMPGLPGQGSMGAQGGMGMLQGGIGALRQITNVAGRALSAVNMFKKGGIMGKISGLASLGGMGGIQGANQMAGMARGVAYGVQQGGLSGALMAGGALAGNQGRSLNALAYNATALERSGNYLRRASGSGDMSSILGAVDSSLAVTSSTLGNLDMASRSNFESGFNSVFAAPQMSSVSYNQNAYNQTARGRVRGAVSDFSVNFAEEGHVPIASRAGTAAGLAIVGAGYGDNSIYSLSRSQGLDDDSAFMAGTALTSYGAKTGNIELFQDMSADPIGRKAMASNPRALSHAVANMVPTPNQSRKSFAGVFDDLNSLGEQMGQSWNQSQRAGAPVVDVSHVRQSPYALDVVYGKATDDNLRSRIGQQRISATTGTLSLAQTMSAAASIVRPTVQSLQQENPSMSISEASMLVQNNVA